MLRGSSALRAGSRLLQQLLDGQAATAAAATATGAASRRSASSSSSAAAAAAAAATAAAPATAPPPPPADDAPNPSSAPNQSPFTREQRMDALLRALVQPVSSSASNTGQLNPHLVNLSPRGERGSRQSALLDPSDALASLLRALLAARAALREDGHIVVVGSSPGVQPIVRAAAASCVSPNVWFMPEGWRPGALTNHASHRRLFRPELHQPARAALREWGALPVNPHAVPSHWTSPSASAGGSREQGGAGIAAFSAGAATATATTATIAPPPPPPPPPPAAVGLAAAPAPPRLGWRDKWLLYGRTREPGTRALLEALIAREDVAHPLAVPGRPRGGLMPRLRLLVVLDPASSRGGGALREAAARGVPTAALVAHNVDLADVTYPILGRDASPQMAWLFLDRLVKVANVGV